MHYLKRNTKYSILAILVIVLSITISISTLAKTEINFSLYDNPQILTVPSIKLEPQTNNINNTSQSGLRRLLKISRPLVQKIINLKNELDCVKDPKDLLKIPELTNIDLREWVEEEIVITVE